MQNGRELGGGLIADGVAFRIFLWLVPFGLVAAAILSFWSVQDPDGLESAAATAAAERALEAAEAADSVGDLFDAAHARLVAGVALAQASDERRAGDAL